MSAETRCVQVVLPTHLRTVARIDGELRIEVAEPVTRRAILDALEARYPMLRGTIRDHRGGRRRAYVRFFASQQDWSNEPDDAPLPEAIARGREPFVVLGAMAGG